MALLSISQRLLKKMTAGAGFLTHLPGNSGQKKASYHGTKIAYKSMTKGASGTRGAWFFLSRTHMPEWWAAIIYIYVESIK